MSSSIFLDSEIALSQKPSYPSWQDFTEAFPDDDDDEAFNAAWAELTGEDEYDFKY